MKHLIIFTFFSFNFLFVSAQQPIASKYSGAFASTYVEYSFLDSNRFYFKTDGHLGNIFIEGDYQISNDTVYLTFDKNNDDSYYNDKFIIDGDSFIVDIYSTLDFCNEKKYKKVSYKDSEIIDSRYISKKRAIKYPQIPTTNFKEEIVVENALNKIFEDKPVKKYLREQKVRFRERVPLATYYDIDFRKTKHIRINGQPAIILDEEDITDKIYVEIKEINLNPTNLDIQLTIHTDGYKPPPIIIEQNWHIIYNDAEVSEYVPDEAIEEVEIPRQPPISETFFYNFKKVDDEWIMERW